MVEVVDVCGDGVNVHSRFFSSSGGFILGDNTPDDSGLVDGLGHILRLAELDFKADFMVETIQEFIHLHSLRQIWDKTCNPAEAYCILSNGRNTLLDMVQVVHCLLLCIRRCVRLDKGLAECLPGG